MPGSSSHANPGNERAIHTYGDFVEDVIQERLERVQGVARVNMFGGTKRELRITVDPERMARYGLTVTEIADALRRSNASISAGDVEEGKRRYVVRTDGELNTPERVAGVVLRSESDPLSGRLGRVTMGDIASVAYRYKEPRRAHSACWASPRWQSMRCARPAPT